MKKTAIYDIGIASDLGINASLIYCMIEEMNRNERPATINNLRGEFSHLSDKQVRTCLKALENNGLVVFSQPNLELMNHTKFYKVVQ